MGHFSATTLSITTLSIMGLFMTLSITTLSIMGLFMTLSITALSLMTLRIMVLSAIMVSAAFHCYAECHYAVILSVSLC
jgi:hypothetical protein